MFGLNEILIIVAIVLGLLFVPRMIARRQQQPPAFPKIKLSGKIRIALAASVLYPALAAAYFQPWHQDQIVFLYIGIGPVVLAWLVCWVYLGFKKK
jgi:hypothetical protein